MNDLTNERIESLLKQCDQCVAMRAGAKLPADDYADTAAALRELLERRTNYDLPSTPAKGKE
jgi:hypothetical protein